MIEDLLVALWQGNCSHRPRLTICAARIGDCARGSKGKYSRLELALSTEIFIPPLRGFSSRIDPVRTRLIVSRRPSRLFQT
jgi:hypothetical protein